MAYAMSRNVPYDLGFVRQVFKRGPNGIYKIRDLFHGQ